ncbi:MAG: hypothetical protein ACRYFZ_07315 [Janthinobacterium lividum]
MPALSGYTLTDRFRKLRNRVVPIITPLQAYLFFELVAICNIAEWPAEFSATNAELQGALGCSEEGLIRARLRLKEVGLIDFVSGNRRTPTRYCFAADGSGELSHSAPKGSGELSKPTAKGSAKGSGELSDKRPKNGDGSAKGSGDGSGELSPYKEQTKTKRRDSSITSKSEVAKPIPFEAFWEAYGKTVGRHKTVERWATLTPAEQAAALAHAPLFAAATPEKQFRKDPLTYLNGKCWLDEELPAPRNGGPQPALVPLPAPPIEAPEMNPEFLAQQDAEQVAKRAARLAELTHA